MKLIEKYKSNNFDKRQKNLNLEYIIIHYTAMHSCQEALKFLCNEKNKVSSHYLISKKGQIYYLVDTEKRAWHAGESYWKGETDINSCSIGIEIDNSGHMNNFEPYNNIQINSLHKLLSFLKSEFKILEQNILGHSDIAPFRKLDPGEKFPWDFLSKFGIVYMPKKNKNISFNENILENIDFLEDSIKMLDFIGYDLRNVEPNSTKFKMLIKAYQMHYVQNNVTGNLDNLTFEIIKNQFKDMLT